MAETMDKFRLSKLGLGIGWRPELAMAIDGDASLGFVEITGEHFAHGRVPEALRQLRRLGKTIIPHGISVSLGSAEGFDRRALKRLDDLARMFESPFVSEHLAFVRAGGVEAGHLLPLPRTRAALNVVVENIRAAKSMLSVPLAIENISALFAWPDAEYSEAAFLREVLERTDALLLLDTSNVHANAHNLGLKVEEFLDGLPLERLAYVHVGGGVESADGTYHDSHAHAVTPEALGVLEELCARVDPPGVMLERDDRFPTDAELREELDRIAAAVQRGSSRRAGGLA